MDPTRAKMAGQDAGSCKVYSQKSRVIGKFMIDTFGFPGWNANSGVLLALRLHSSIESHTGTPGLRRVWRPRDLPNFWSTLVAVQLFSGSIGQSAAADFMGGVFFSRHQGRLTCLERTDENGASLSGSAFKVFTINVR